MRVGKPCRRLLVESRDSVRAEFLDKLVGLVVELSSPVLGVVGSSPASVSLSLSQIYNINVESTSVLRVISLLATDTCLTIFG